jgi:hypothetical protein
MDAVTETPGRVDGRAAPFGGRGWTHFGWWLFVWNVATPIRLLGGMPLPGSMGRAIAQMTVDQTSWAIATYVMFRLALRARHAPLRQVLTVLGVVALPLLVLRYWVMGALLQAFGWPGRPVVRALLVNGPTFLFLLLAAAALGAVALSPRGYALLATLVTRPGAVITRSQLLREIWGYSSDVMSRTVDMHIMELRRKLEVDATNPRHFYTVRKAGYRFTLG